MERVGNWPERSPLRFCRHTIPADADPDGLSVFGLVTTKATETKSAEDPDADVVPVSKPSMSTNVSLIARGLSTIQEKTLVYVFIIAVTALVACFGWWKKRV